MAGSTPRPTTVDEYLAGFDEPRAARLSRIRELCLAAAPEAEETLKWGAPAYVDGTILFQFAGYARHVNVVVTPSSREAFDGRFGRYETGKGSVKLPYDAPLPEDLISDLLGHRVREWADRGVRWM